MKKQKSQELKEWFSLEIIKIMLNKTRRKFVKKILTAGIVVFCLFTGFVFEIPEAHAAFPQVAATNSGNSGGNATSTVVSMPTGVTTGDLVLVFFTKDGTAAPTETTAAATTTSTESSSGLSAGGAGSFSWVYSVPPRCWGEPCSVSCSRA